LGSYKSGLITPVLRLSDTTRRGAPPKNENAATCAATHAPWSIHNTGRTNMCRLAASTMMNAHTRRTRSATGSNHDPTNP
jgi:hypothetical protein